MRRVLAASESRERGDELKRLDGLGEAGLETALERLFEDGVAGEGGDSDGGNRRELACFLGFADLAKQGETVDHGETEVADDHVGSFAIEGIARGRRGIDGVDGGAGFDEHGGESAAGRCGVLDQEDVTTGEKTLEVGLVFRWRDAGIRILGGGGQSDPKRGAGSDALAFGVNIAAVKLGDLARDGEAETDAAFGANARVFDLDETFEDLLEVLASDADAVVAHHEFDPAGGIPDKLDDDATARRGELDGVFDEVTDELGETPLIGVEKAGVGRKGVDEFDALDARGFAPRVDASAEGVAQVDVATIEAKFPGHDAGRVDEVFDEFALFLGAALDRIEGFAKLLGINFVLVLDEAGPKDDRGKGGAELVGDAGEKAVLGVVGGVDFAARLGEGAAGGFEFLSQAHDFVVGSNNVALRCFRVGGRRAGLAGRSLDGKYDFGASAHYGLKIFENCLAAMEQIPPNGPGERETGWEWSDEWSLCSGEEEAVPPWKRSFAGDR